MKIYYLQESEVVYSDGDNMSEEPVASFFRVEEFFIIATRTSISHVSLCLTYIAAIALMVAHYSRKESCLFSSQTEVISQSAMKTRVR
jgi:hypothetical protein